MWEEMADQVEKIQAFRNVMRDNRKIVLTHKGERYKARSIVDVLYSSRTEGEEACHHCGDAREFISADVLLLTSTNVPLGTFTRSVAHYLPRERLQSPLLLVT